MNYGTHVLTYVMYCMTTWAFYGRLPSLYLIWWFMCTSSQLSFLPCSSPYIYLMTTIFLSIITECFNAGSYNVAKGVAIPLNAIVEPQMVPVHVYIDVT